MGNVVIQGKNSTAKSSGGRTPEEIYSTGNALHNTLATRLAGEELVGDMWLSQLRITKDWNWVVLTAPLAAEVLVVPEPCRIGGVLKLSDAGATGTILMRNDNVTLGGSAGVSFAAVGDIPEGMRFTDGITITFGTGTGNILVWYREAEFTA